MNAQKIVFDAAAGGGNKIAGFFCPATADVAPKGIFQICHGMADYFGRYEELIDHLNNDGWHVCGMDMLGHGQTYELNKDRDMPLGFFGEAKDAAYCILKDEMALHELAKEFFGAGADGKRLPMVLYGHSMGSFVARNIYITFEFAREFVPNGLKRSVPFRIGGDEIGTETWNGVIDEVRVESIARSPEWINAMYERLKP